MLESWLLLANVRWLTVQYGYYDKLINNYQFNHSEMQSHTLLFYSQLFIYTTIFYQEKLGVTVTENIIY